MKKSTETTRFDSTEYLDSDEAVSAYLDEASKSGDPTFVAHAHRTVSRARGMSKTAKSTPDK